jgi:hypothetical protein
MNPGVEQGTRAICDPLRLIWAYKQFVRARAQWSMAPLHACTWVGVSMRTTEEGNRGYRVEDQLLGFALH